jgi:hypothetical protein
MTDLKIGLRKQKHICPLCNRSLVNDTKDLIILYLDGNKDNRKDRNIVIVHRACYEESHAEVIEIEESYGNKSNSRVPLTKG